MVGPRVLRCEKHVLAIEDVLMGVLLSLVDVSVRADMADNAVLESTEAGPLGVHGACATLAVGLVNRNAHEAAQNRLQKMAAKLALAHRSKIEPVPYVQ